MPLTNQLMALIKREIFLISQQMQTNARQGPLSPSKSDPTHWNNVRSFEANSKTHKNGKSCKLERRALKMIVIDLINS